MKYDAGEMRDYWRRHEQQWGEIDYETDPDGIVACCGLTQPLWLTRYHDRLQRTVYRRLLAEVPRAVGAERPRALDVGCGAGRWSRLLADTGFAVTGIDVQETLVAANTRRHPDVSFEVATVQEYAADEPFDLVSSVLVYQHIPFDQQADVARRLRALLRPGGHLLLLEGILHDLPHFFTHSVEGWCETIEPAGFESKRVVAFNYEPAVHALLRVRGGATASAAAPAGGSAPRRRRSPLASIALRGGATVDRALQPLLLRLQPPLRATHAGMLFVATGS